MIRLRYRSLASGILFLVVVIAVVSHSGQIAPPVRRSTHEEKLVARISRFTSATPEMDGVAVFRARQEPADAGSEVSLVVESSSEGSGKVDSEAASALASAGHIFNRVPAYNEKDNLWLAVQSDLSGSLLQVNGRRAQVVGFQQVSGSGGIALSLIVDPADNHVSGDVALENSDTSGGSPPTPIVDEVQSASVSVGLTYEQQLFRTKWGWHAFDQVQKVLREETSD